MAKKVLFCVICFLVCAAGQRITTIHLDGVQYFISRMNPYSPELNYFLAYQYCRSLGLQLASFETKEKAESMTTYLKNAGYGNYDFWTSGNRLGTGMFLWMSTGLPFNATFDFFENSVDSIQAGLLDPIDHNSNTSPQRTARDSSSGAEKGCVILRQPTLKWMPEDCSAVKDFICEQTRCYYYNYGSIPVSSAQGRPISLSTSRPSEAMSTLPSTTPHSIVMPTYSSFTKKEDFDVESQPSYVSLKIDHERALVNEDENSESNTDVDIIEKDEEHIDSEYDDKDEQHARGLNDIKEHVFSQDEDEIEHDVEQGIQELHQQLHEQYNDSASLTNEDNGSNVKAVADTFPMADNIATFVEENPAKAFEPAVAHLIATTAPVTEASSVEVRLKQISQEIEKLSINKNNGGGMDLLNQHLTDTDDIGRQSFLSLTDLIRTLRPTDKQIIPQIDSDYSNAMRVLGESSSLVSNNDSRKYKDTDTDNHALI